MAKKKESDERRKHGRINIKNNLFAALGSTAHQKCVVLDISEGGLAFRYYEGSDLIKDLADEKAAKIDVIVDKGELFLSQIPVKSVYDADIESELPIDSINIKRKGVKFGRLSKEQRSRLKELVSDRQPK